MLLFQIPHASPECPFLFSLHFFLFALLTHQLLESTTVLLRSEISFSQTNLHTHTYQLAKLCSLISAFIHASPENDGMELNENEDGEEENKRIRRTKWKELKIKRIEKDLGIRELDITSFFISFILIFEMLKLFPKF